MAAWLYALPGIAKAGFGLYQMVRGSAMKPQRPTYQTPGEISENLALARQQEAGRMPGFAYAEDRLRQQSAQGMYGLQRGVMNQNQLMSGLANIQMQTSIAQRSLMESEASDYYRRLANLQRSLQTSAQYRDKEFEINKMQPFQEAARTKAALIEGGLKNIMGGASEAVMQPTYAQMLKDQGMNARDTTMFEPFFEMKAPEIKIPDYSKFGLQKGFKR